MFIVYLYQQINNLKTPLFNAASLDLSIILVFNLKSLRISEMGSMVFPFESEICALLSLLLERLYWGSDRVEIYPPEDGSRTHFKMV
jgi:hypothetical protein